VQSNDERSPLNVADYEALARERLPAAVYDYYAGGAEDEATLRWNTAAYRRWAFRPRVLRDVSTVDTAITLLGRRLALPVLLAPTAFQRLAHPDGERATAAAAAEAGTILVASTLSTTTIEETAAACRDPLWFQLYVYRDRELSRDLVRRAESSGCSALCLTVTVPTQGNRERDARNAFRLPDGMEMANFTGRGEATMPSSTGSGLQALIAGSFDASLDWSALEWLRSITDLPIIVKGIITAEDAALAVDHGAAAVIVSNHGGRQLDGALPTLAALPDVLEGAAGRVPVLIDGGIRRGADVIRALCLGATAALIGRPYLWGLAVGGRDGVRAVLDILAAEIRRTLTLLGRPSLEELDRSALEDLARHALS
jgi:4-hydroxymandelate oxidase